MKKFIQLISLTAIALIGFSLVNAFTAPKQAFGDTIGTVSQWLTNTAGNYIYPRISGIKVSSTQFCLGGSCLTAWSSIQGTNYWSDSGTALSPVTSTRSLTINGTSTLATMTSPYICLTGNCRSSWPTLTEVDPIFTAASTTFLTTTTAANTYLPLSVSTSLAYIPLSASTTYLTTTTAASTYLPLSASTSLDWYLTTTTAANTYLTLAVSNSLPYLKLVDSATSTWNKALEWDGGATDLVAATGRTSLGLGTMATQNTTDYNTTSTDLSLFSPLAGSASLTTVGTIGSGTWGASVISATYGGTGTSTYTWPSTQGAASTVLTNNGSGVLSWGTVSGGDLTFATQQAWTSVFTVAYLSTTTVTTSAATQALASTTANAIINKLIQWTDSGGTTVKRGWVVTASNSGTVITITVNGNNILNTDTNFRVARYFIPYTWDWYIPGACVADASNPVGKQYFVASGTTAQLLSINGNLGTAGAGNAPTLTFNVYDGANTTIETAPNFTNQSTLYDKQFTTSTIVANDRVTIRTPACTFSTTTASDLNLVLYWAPSTWFTY